MKTQSGLELYDSLDRLVDETSLVDVLEHLIDKHGPDTVLESTARVCFEKSSHIFHHWNDPVTAINWERLAKEIEAIDC